MAFQDTIYRSLIGAADALGRVNLLVDLSPQKHVAEALRESAKAFELLRRGKFYQASKLKSAVHSVASVDRTLKRNQPTLEGDQQMIVLAAQTFREVASTLQVSAAAAEPVQDVTAKPSRVLKSFRDISHEDIVTSQPEVPQTIVHASADALNVGDLDKLVESVREASKKLTKLPKSVADGRWTVQRAPILLYSHTRIPDVSFIRPGIEKYDKINQALSFKRRGATQHGYLLHDQLVIGFNKNDELFDKRRKTPVSRGVIKRQAETNAGVITRAIDALSAKLGQHFNVLSENDPPYIVLRGNPLVWVWVLPTRTGKDFVPKIASVSFPVMSPENYQVKQGNIQAMRRELDELERMREVLAKKKQVLDDSKLARYLELHRILHTDGIKQESSPEQKRERLASLRKQLDAEVEQKFASQIGEIQDLRAQIEDMVATGPAARTERLKINREIKALENTIAQGRAKLARKYQAQLK